LTEILHVFGPQFFGGSAPKVLDLHYKIEPVSDRKVSRRSAEGPRRLGVEKKENITSKIEDLPYYLTGRSNEMFLPARRNALRLERVFARATCLGVCLSTTSGIVSKRKELASCFFTI